MKFTLLFKKQMCCKTPKEIMEQELPVGFRFYPTEVELILFYLRIQLGGGDATIHSLIPVLDVFSVEPTQLPSTYAIYN